jgi:AcrR family transcriptional regulator
MLTAPRHASRSSLRDPERTRGRILSAAALREFAAKGFAGARVARIARRARVNKRMLYHYFGNKDDLFREILSRKLGERMAWASAAPEDPSEGLAYWSQMASRDTDWVRLMQWEALEASSGVLSREAEREQASGWALDQVRARHAAGLLADDLDAAPTLLSMVALTTFPVAFPQITRLVTGLAPADPQFQKQHADFLRHFARRLGPVAHQESTLNA